LLCLQSRRYRRSSFTIYSWFAPEGGTFNGKALAEK